MEEGQLAMEVYAGGGGDTGLDFAQTAMGQAELFIVLPPSSHRKDLQASPWIDVPSLPRCP
jgi:hypothetical protein